MDWTEITICVPAEEVERAGDIAQMVVPVSYTHLAFSGRGAEHLGHTFQPDSTAWPQFGHWFFNAAPQFGHTINSRVTAAPHWGQERSLWLLRTCLLYTSFAGTEAGAISGIDFFF